MSNQDTHQSPFTNQIESIREAGQSMKSTLLQQMQSDGEDQEYGNSVRAFETTVREQVNDFVTTLQSTIQEQMNSFMTEAKEVEKAKRDQ